MMIAVRTLLVIVCCTALVACSFAKELPARPHIVLVMADDMGWGETGYRGHPVLKTPNLDAMAAAGLRLERFYAGSPVCSPTRASVMTGRSPDRTGVLSHGYALRPQEKTIAQALAAAGYVTGHFGKWHLSGYSGPGVPVLASDPRSPGRFGFQQWLSVTNFFDLDPQLSRSGEIEQFQGDSSEVIVREAINFLRQHRDGQKPMFAVVWFGTPHNPFRALEADRAQFDELDEQSANHYGELVALDRSIGTLRTALRELEISENTMLVFCSDNGGLQKVELGTTGGLRGYKSSVYEGGLRVPGIIEWPAAVQPRVSNFPACTFDLFPTIAEIVGLDASVFVRPVDGVSLVPVLRGEVSKRERPLGFRFGKKAAWIDGRYKLVTTDRESKSFALYDLELDPQEQHDLVGEQPERLAELREAFAAWNESVEASFAGRDYPEGRVEPADPAPLPWYQAEEYRRYLPAWRNRWEVKSYLQQRKD
jgi:arylsulfatase A-like enzyme